MLSLTTQRSRWTDKVQGGDTTTGPVREGAIERYYYRHRVYAAQLGRFLSRDPIGYADGHNVLQYVSGNAVGTADPHGLKRLPVGNCCGKSYDTTTHGCCVSMDATGMPTGGTIYPLGEKCCDEGKFVAKVPIWKCKRYANIRLLGLCIWHHYLCCDAANGNTCYGLGPGDKTGLPVTPEVIKGGTCEKKWVCPRLKRKKCNKPICRRDWKCFGNNCWKWADID
jgi:RHS repeat-associated protein